MIVVQLRLFKVEKGDALARPLRFIIGIINFNHLAPLYIKYGWQEGQSYKDKNWRRQEVPYC